MASLEFLVTESNTKKRKLSGNETVDFLSVRIGASQMEILENSGAFDFSAKALKNIASINPGQITNPDQIYSFTGDFTQGSAVIENVVGTMPSAEKQSKYFYTIFKEGFFDEPNSVEFTDADTITVMDGDSAIASGTGVQFYIIPGSVLKTNDETETTGPALLTSGTSTNGSSGAVILAPGDAVPTNATTIMQGIKYTAAPLGGVGNIYSVRNQIDATLTTQTSGAVSQNSVYLVVSGTTGADFTNVGGTTNPTVGTTFRATNNNTPTAYGDYVIQRIVIAGTGIRLLNRIPAGLTRDQLLSAINQTFNITHDFTAITDGSSVTQTAATSILGGAKRFGDVLLGGDNQTGYVKIAAPYLTFVSTDPVNTNYLTTEYVQGSTNSPIMVVQTGNCGGTGNTGSMNIRSGDNDGDGGSGSVNIRSGVVRGTTASGGLTMTTGATQALSTANSGAINLLSGSINGLGGNSGGSSVSTGTVAATAAATSASGATNISTGGINVLTSTVSTGGAQIFSGINATNSTGGTGIAAVTSGNLTGTGSGTTGTVTLRSGNVTNASSTANSGLTQVRTGTVAGSGVSGNLTLDTGTTVNGTSGTVNMGSGSNSTSGGTGSVNITSGNYNGTAASGTGTFNWNTGNITQAGASGNTGPIFFRSGNNSGTGNSGTVAISSGTVTTGSSSGVSFGSGSATTGNTGQLSLNTGTTGGSGASGNIEFSSGNTVNGGSGYLHAYTGIVSGSGNSGDSFLSTGGTQSGNSGSSALSTGSSVSGNTGSITVQTGLISGTAATTTGQVTIASGGMTNGSATASTGVVQIFSGHASAGPGNSGNASLSSGNATAGNSGFVSVQSGSSATGTTGNVAIGSGQVSSGTFSSGFVNIQSGNATSTRNSGGLALRTGNVVDGAAGFLNVTSGDATGAGDSGSAGVGTGNATSGFSGGLNAYTGSVTTGFAGSANFYGGNNTGVSGNAGPVNITGGNLTGANTSGVSGWIHLNSGDVTNASATTGAAEAVLRSGDNSGSGFSSQLLLRSGNTASGNSGDVNINSGNVAGGSGNSGNINLTAGSVSAGNRGGVYLTGKYVQLNSAPGGNIHLNNTTNGGVALMENSNVKSSFLTFDQSMFGYTVNNTWLGSNQSGSYGTLGILGASDTASNPAGNVIIAGGFASNGSNNGGDVYIGTGGHTSTGNGGSVTIAMNGTTKGKLSIKDGSEGTVGHVWTSTDTTGGGHWAAPSGGGPSPFAWNTVTRTSANNNAVVANGDEVQADTTTAFTLLLPPTPSQGHRVRFQDKKGTWATNNLTIDRNGKPIRGINSNFALNVNYGSAEFVYSDATDGWLVSTNY